MHAMAIYRGLANRSPKKVMCQLQGSPEAASWKCRQENCHRYFKKILYFCKS